MKNFNFLSNLLQRVSAMSGMRAETINYDGQPTVNRRTNMTSVLRHCKASDVRVAQEWCESGARVAQEWLQKSSARVAQGLRKSIRFAATILVLLFIGVGSAWGALTEEYSYTFTAKQFANNSTAKTLGTITWTPSTSWKSGSGYWGYDGTKGQQWGSKDNGLNTLTLTAGSSISNIKKITINASIAKNGSCKLSVKVGSTTIGSEKTLTTTATDYNFESATGLTGAVQIKLYNNSVSKAQYIKSITIYTEAAASKTYYIWDGSEYQTSTESGSSISKNPTALCTEGAAETYGWVTSEYASSTAPSPRYWKDASWPTGETKLYAVYYYDAGSGNAYYSTHPTIYNVSYNTTHATLEDGSYTCTTDILDLASPTYGSYVYAYFTPESGYTLDESCFTFTYTSGGTTFTPSDISYNSSTGELWIDGVDGNITITAVAKTCTKLPNATGLSVNTDYVSGGNTYVRFSWTPGALTTTNGTYQEICFGLVGDAGKCVSSLSRTATYTGDLKSKLADGEYWWSIKALGDGTTYCDGDAVDGEHFTICNTDITSSTPDIVPDTPDKTSCEVIFDLTGANSYSVTLKNNSTNAVVGSYNNVSNTTGDITFTGLTPNTTYRVEVVAHNACGDNSLTGSETFTTAALTLYTVTFHNAAGSEPDAVTQTAEGGTVSIPSASACEGWTFVGWKVGGSQSSTTTDPTSIGTWITSASWPKNYAPEGNIDVYAVFSKTEGGGVAVTDELTPSAISNPSSYSDWSDKSLTSNAVYAGQSSGGNSYLQLRSKNSNSGVVMTTSGGNVTKVAVTWSSSTQSGRTLNVYGKNSAYSAATDLYNASNQGTLIGTIVCGTSTELNITKDYAFIGFRSDDGAMYLDEVDITIGGGGATTWRSDPPCSTAKLDHITITTPPTTTNYLVGQVFSSAGAVVTAYYDDESHHEVTASWTPTTPLTAGTGKTVKASYTEGGVTKTATTTINVYAVTLQKKDENNADIASTPPTVSCSVAALSASETGNSYKFKEWQISGASLDDASSLTPNIINVTGEVTVTAVYWKPITVTWYVSGSGSSNIYHTDTHAHGWSLMYPTNPDPEDYSCDGKVFVGWTRLFPYTNASIAPALVASGTEITSDENLYAVFATETNAGTPPTWTKTALGSVTAGTYLMCTADGHVFNGEINASNRGQITASAFSSFTTNTTFNVAAPSGSCELTFTQVATGHFTMYAAGKGYLYCSESTASHIKWHETETDYWFNKTSHWRYSGAKDGSGNETAIVSYSNSDFRNYVSPGANTAAVVLLKKTAAGSPATYSNYTTSCACEGFSFHTGSGTDEAVKTTNTRSCFEQVESGTTWQIENYTIPSDAKFFVGWQDEFKSSGLGTSSRSSVQTWAAEMYFEYSKNYGDGWRKTVGAATGAVGTLRIWSDNNWNNCHVGFAPNGYVLKLGSTSLEMHDATSGLDGAQYKETDVVTLTGSDISGNFQVNLYTGSAGGVACDNSVSKAMTTMGVKSGSGDNWRGASVNASTDANTKGFFRIDLAQTHTDTKNWNAHWVPCWELKFDYKGGSGAIATTPAYVSVEGDAAARTVTIPNTAPTKDGYRFMGWSDDDNNTVEYAAGSTHNVTLSGNKTVYAVWKQVYTVTYDYAGGTGTCSNGEYIEGEAVTVCASTPTKAGSDFNGWSYTPSVTVSAGKFTMPASNVVITATWTDHTYVLNHSGSNYTNTENQTTIKSGDTPLTLHYTCAGTYGFPNSISISGGGKSWTVGTDYTWTVATDKKSATLVINATTITANVTITITMSTLYTVIWDEHGVTTTEYYSSDDNNVTLKTGIADCGEKKFYGWTEDAEFVSHATTPPTMASSGAISGNKHYYAIFGDKSGGDGFVLVTSITAGEGYYMATGLTSSDKVYTGQNASNSYGSCTANNSTGSSFRGETLLAFPTAAKSLTVAISNGKFSLYDGTSYLGAANSNSLIFDDDPVYEWKLSDNKIQSQSYTSRYIKRNTGNERVCAYETTSGVADMHLYKPNVSWTNFSKTCTLYDIEITTPSGGEVTTTPAAGTGVAGEGQMVTVNVTPNSCKYLSALKYNDGSDHAISIASTPYTFTMPASDVTVTATFADKSVSSISANTATHRTLMQNTSFEGEQIRVTYNNGETEDLAWNDASLTFSGYNMSTLGEQTVSVAYSGSCGSANTSYSIEITDGIPVTFSDCGITTVRKYEPGDVVPVETTAGEYACAGWVFAGWSETEVPANSTEFTPVYNFNASTAKTLYAVYSKEGNTWLSALNISEMRSGAKYVIVKNYSYGNEYALTNTVDGTYYLDGSALSPTCETVKDAYNNNRYQLQITPTASMIWIVKKKGSKWVIYNPNQNKYLKLTSDGYAQLTTSCEDEFTLSNGYNDSEIDALSLSEKHLSWRNSSPGYFNGYTSGVQWYLTNNEQFSSNPPCAPQSAVFHGNGGTVIADGGSPTGGDLTIREATRDAGITTPTAEYEDCDGKSWSFIGWADHEVDVTRVPVLTTDLLNDGGGNKSHTITTDGEQFWAVYTNQGEPMTQYGTISFSMSDIRLDYHTDETEVTKTVPAMGDYTFGYKRMGHQSNTGIQLESTTGEFYNKTSLGRVNAISFNTFVVGGINNLKVYVGDAEKATTYELTAAELQVVGTTYTYYPSHNCEYVYIKNYNSYVCVEGISIEFGKGTKVWATTPDCKRVTLSGDIYATSTNGRGIMAVTPLRVNAFQLDPSAGIVITSNSSDVYFTENRTPNFAMAAANQPKNSITLTAGSDGNLTTDIYVHYKPSSAGDGVPADVNVYANLAEPDPGVTATHPIHVRNMPEKFVIAAKVGAAWYALPADMSGATNPAGVLIDVDETSMTAIAPNTCSYTLWPVKTVNPASSTYDRYGTNATYDYNAFGERVRFSAINNGNKGLWANNATGVNTINNYAVIAAVGDGGTTENTNPSYEWIITTSVTDGNWQYTLQTDQTQNNRYLRYWSAAAGGPKWGTYASGEQNLYFLPVTEVEPFEMQVVEWYPTKVLVQTEAALASPTVKVNSESVASPVLTDKGGKLWEISGLPLESNPTKSMTVAFTADEKNYACTKTVPIIISREAKTQASEPFATLGAAIYTKSDVVVRDGAVLTVNGSNAANTFNDVTIYPTSKISVPSDKKLTVHSLTFFGGIDEIYDGSAYAINKYGVPELSLKGTLHKSIAQIDYVMRVDDSQMYSLTVPYDVNLADITYWDGTSMGTLGDKLWVSAYDGAARANKDMSHTWIWEANFASKGLEEKLKAGVGYTISADLQAGVGSTYSILRMPMASNVENDGTELAKTVPVVAYGSESAVSDNHKGWNLVGNPYMVSIGGKDKGGSDSTNLSIGYLKETGTGPWEWVSDECRYVTIPADNGQDYWQEKFSSATLKPFKNFFVQVGNTGTLSFALASRQNAPARYLEAQKREVEFEINLANGSHQDHTGLLIAEEYSTAYEINADLEKMENAMAVYTLTGGYKLAYNALSPDDAEQLIPVGYVANIAGTYTFDLDETSDVSEVEHIWLTDYELSRVVDLIDEVYEFTTSNGRNESRFALSVELKDEQQTPTGILNAEANDGRALKFIWQDKMYIMRNGVIYDATGKQVR